MKHLISKTLALGVLLTATLLAAGMWAMPAPAHEIIASNTLEAPHAIGWTRWLYTHNTTRSSRVQRFRILVDPSLEMADGETYEASIQPPPLATATPASVANVAKGATTEFRMELPPLKVGADQWSPDNRLDVYAGAIRVTIVASSADPEDATRRSYLLPYEIEIGNQHFR